MYKSCSSPASGHKDEYRVSKKNKGLKNEKVLYGIRSRIPFLCIFPGLEETYPKYEVIGKESLKG